MQENVDIVQFASAVYYCSEEEGKVNVDIIRLGEEDNACSVCYETQDVSALAGVKYIKTQGELRFEPGEFFIENREKIAAPQGGQNIIGPRQVLGSPNSLGTEPMTSRQTQLTGHPEAPARRSPAA